jgi:preprotein translocase subunit SecA
MSPTAQALPRPGPRWGSYPQRPSARHGGQHAAPDPFHWRGLPTWLPTSWAPIWHRRWLMAVRARSDRLLTLIGAPSAQGLPPAPFTLSASARQMLAQALSQARLGLRRHGLRGDSLIEGLATVAAVIEQALGRRPHDTQLLAAAMLTDQRAVEMATGEGKTLAMAMGAALAALAGVPTHVVTANDYLAERDARELAPLWSALGLHVGHIATAHTPEQRRAIYRHDIVYATAKELAFDHLRDCIARPGSGHEQPVLRGLCLALLDEADSILLDEAIVPLIISVSREEPANHQAQRRALWWQAWRLSQALGEHAHFERAPQGRGMRLTPAGEALLDAQAAPLGGIWRRPRLRHELVQMALSARHGLHKDEHYLLRDDGIVLLDTLTGRVAEGRVWSQGLQALIEIKEGRAASAPTETLAQLTFQRFFQRYWRMGALSGTLTEAARELRHTYGLRTHRLPTRLPSQRRRLPTCLFDTDEARWHAVAVRAATLRTLGRPVLIGTDTVADSERLAWHLEQAGVPHTVLNARHDAAEAAIVAQAGESGRITVATRMAGRGTDVHLDAAALAAGGLHVIHCQRNESRRMDRQLQGRSARQGQPGSTETWLCTGILADRDKRPGSKLMRWISSASSALIARSPVWALGCLRLHQWMQSQRQVALRQQLLEQDRQWESHQQQARRPGSPSA